MTPTQFSFVLQRSEAGQHPHPAAVCRRCRQRAPVEDGAHPQSDLQGGGLWAVAFHPRRPDLHDRRRDPPVLGTRGAHKTLRQGRRHLLHRRHSIPPDLWPGSRAARR